MPPPRELLDAMAQVSAMPPDENQALAQAIVESFGPCVCQQHEHIAGHDVFIEMCAGHRFLSEQDAHCSRVDRLRFARARSEHWRLQEWMGLSNLLTHDLGL